MADAAPTDANRLASGHRGTRAVQRMVEHAPSSGGLALWVNHADLPADSAADAPAGAPLPPAWTDGHTVHYRPAFAQLSLPLQAGWVAHEVLHIALRHGPRFLALQARLGQADLKLFKVCADAIVNSALAHLAWLQPPPGAVRLETLLDTALGQPQSAETALLVWDVERLYLAVDDRQVAGKSSPDSAKNQAPADGPRARRARALAQPEAADLHPVAAGQGGPEDEAEATRTWAERLLRGEFEGGATRLIDSIGSRSDDRALLLVHRR